MSSNTNLIIWAAVVLTAFFVLWRRGYLVRLSNYVAETRDELKKCTWPSVDELKGSTIVVTLALVLLGAFTMVINSAITWVVQKII